MKFIVSILCTVFMVMTANITMAVGLSGNSVALVPMSEKFRCELITQQNSNLQCRNRKLTNLVNQTYNDHLDKYKNDTGNIAIEFITDQDGDVVSSRIVNSTIQSETTLKRIYMKSKRTRFSDDKLKNARFVYSFSHIQ